MNSMLLGAAWGLAAALLIAIAALIGVWWERKVAGRIHLRYGPQEAGPSGLLQTLADTVKLVLKEDITPTQADVAVFRTMPFLVFVPIASALVVIPYASGWAPLDISTGALFFLAVPGLSVLGILLAGWSSQNTYASIGGVRGGRPDDLLRTAKDSLGPGAVPPCGFAFHRHDPSRVAAVVDPLTALGFLVYFISSIAEVNRGPFDLPEAESELVRRILRRLLGHPLGDLHDGRVRGCRCCIALRRSGLLGGGLGLPEPFAGVVFVGIAMLIATAMIWAKWTFPRMRPDQLMGLAWKVLTPMASCSLSWLGWCCRGCRAHTPQCDRSRPHAIERAAQGVGLERLQPGRQGLHRAVVEPGHRRENHRSKGAEKPQTLRYPSRS